MGYLLDGMGCLLDKLVLEEKSSLKADAILAVQTHSSPHLIGFLDKLGLVFGLVISWPTI